MRLNIGVSALAAVLFASPVPAWALTPAVHDDAGFFSADAVTKADANIKDIKERHHKDLLIETFPTPPADKEEEAKGDDGKANPSFFAAWALQRARAQHVNGIYVLDLQRPAVHRAGGRQPDAHPFHGLRPRPPRQDPDRSLQEEGSKGI